MFETRKGRRLQELPVQTPEAVQRRVSQRVDRIHQRCIGRLHILPQRPFTQVGMRPDPGSVRGRITQCLLGNRRDASTCAGDFALGVGQPGIVGIARGLKMQIAMVPEALAIQLFGLLEPHVWRRMKGLEGKGPALKVLPCLTLSGGAAKVAAVICPQGLRFHSVCHPGQQRRDDESDGAHPIAMHRCLLVCFHSQLISLG